MITLLDEHPEMPSESDGAGRLSRTVFIAGVLLWCLVQGYLILMPVYTRTMLPEPDDTLPYVLRTARMAECFSQDCPAFSDLREQLLVPSLTHEVATYRAWVASSFGAQHPLFSLVLLGLSRFGMDLLTAYKVVCAAAVVLFGAGFACLLAALFGLPAAGFSMTFLAFKVFPDTGLNFVVPSNLAMGVSLFVLARVIYRRGRAPWALGLGTLAMAGIHPVGLLYAALAAVVAWSLIGFSMPRKAWPAALAAVVVVLVAGLLLPSKIYGLPRYLELVSLGALLRQGTASAAAVFAQTANLRDGLLGSIPLFCAAVAGGFLTLGGERRVVLKRTLIVYGVFLIVALFYPPREPGDTFLRIWIPFVAMVFGLAGRSVWASIRLLRSSGGQGRADFGSVRLHVRDSRPVAVIILALMLGWWIQMVYAGAEQVLVTAEHYRKRQPLHVCESQPRLLLSAAKPGDRVLYLSMQIMPFYLINGCLNLGAVYYHDALKGTDTVREWLSRPELRFAAAFNPLVYHPSFEGLHERRWGISSPGFRFSEWNEPRIYGPVLQEDAIPLGDYKWIEIEPEPGPFPSFLHVTVENPDTESHVRLMAVGNSGEPIPGLETTCKIAGSVVDRITSEYEGAPDAKARMFGKSGKLTRVDIDLQPFAGQTRRLRLVFSGWKSTARLAGLSFDQSPHHWPWDQKARLTLMHRKWEVGKVTFTFDPALILPDPVNRKELKVLDDCGGSVLFQIGP